MTRNQISVIIMLATLLVLSFSSCSDLLMQLGNQGDAAIAISDEIVLTLQIETDPVISGDDTSLTVAQGTVVTCIAVANPHDESLSLTYRWYLDGEELSDSDPGVILQANTLELESSIISPGTSEIKATVHEATCNLFREDVITLIVQSNVADK